MKIGITCYPTYGGSGTVATELGRNLAKRGHKVHFITTALPYRLSEFVENVIFHEVQVFNYPLFDYVPYSLSLASKMAQVALREELDVLHVHYAIPHATSAYLAKKILEKKRPLPVITTLHGTDITLVGMDPSYYDITKFSIEESDAITSVSTYLKTQTLYRFAVEKNIEVITNFVDTNHFVPNSSKEKDCRHCLCRPGEKIMMHISNFRPVKRVTDIIEIFDGVQKQIECRLVMIGEGPDKGKAMQLADEKGLRDRITFLGKQDDVALLIPCADVYMLPSSHESFGLTALEAMSCGVPVIGTSGSGMDEYLGDGKAGLLFPVGDIEAMIGGVLKILCNDNISSKMGENGRKRAIEDFHVDKIVGKYEEVYKRFL
jgi:L-malate glycosyltransferase